MTQKMPICDKVAILIVGFHELVKTEKIKHTYNLTKCTVTSKALEDLR